MVGDLHRPFGDSVRHRGLVYGHGPSVVDPATYALTLYLRPEFNGAPWVGTASAGTSSGHNFASGGTSPSNGAALNGHVGADFNGTTQNLVCASGVCDLAGYVGSAGGVACGGAVLFKADTATADAGAGLRKNNPCFFADANSIVNYGFSSAGIHISCINTAVATKEVVIACSTGAWHALFWKIASNTVYLALDGGAWQSIALAADLHGSRDQGIYMGRSAAAATYFDGIVQESLVMSAAAPTDLQVTDIRAYFASIYGVSV